MSDVILAFCLCDPHNAQPSLCKLPLLFLETIGYVQFSRHALHQRLTKSPMRRLSREKADEEKVGEEVDT